MHACALYGIGKIDDQLFLCNLHALDLKRMTGFAFENAVLAEKLRALRLAISNAYRGHARVRLSHKTVVTCRQIADDHIAARQLHILYVVLNEDPGPRLEKRNYLADIATIQIHHRNTQCSAGKHMQYVCT